MSKLDSQQILPIVYDETTQALKITGSSSSLPVGAATEAKQDTGNSSLSSIKTNTDKLDVNASTRASEATLSAAKADLDLLASTVSGGKVQIDANLTVSDIEIGAVELKDGATDTRVKIKTDGVDNALVITQNSQPLPTGAATSTKQDTGNTSLSSIDSKVVSADTGNVTIISSSLPTGASTSAKQDTGNTSLASIKTNTDSLDVALSTRDIETTLSSLNSKVTTVDTTNVTVTSNALPTGASTSAKQDTGNTSLASIKTNTDELDVALSTRASESTLSSLNVKVTAVDTGNVTIASSALPTGAATSTLQTLGNISLSEISSGLLVAQPRKMKDGAGNSLTSSAVGSHRGLEEFSLGFNTASFTHNNNTTNNITTTTYVELVTSTATESQEIELSDTSGEVLKIAFGAAGFEVDQFLVIPGGNGRIRLRIPASTRISVKAISANATSGFLCLNLFG